MIASDFSTQKRHISPFFSKPLAQMKSQAQSHIYWFAPYKLICPSTRYRGKYPLEYLQNEKQISYDFIWPEKSWAAILKFCILFLEVLFFRKQNSIVVIQKVCTNRFYANLLKLLIWLRNENSVYDLDDAEYYRWPSQTLNFFLKHCQYVQVGSEALRQYCLQWNDNVSIATSPVISHEHRSTKKSSKPVLGWVGDFGNGNPMTKAFSHKTNLYKLFFSSLEKINYPLKLVLIGVKQETDIPELKALFSQYPNIELEIPINLDWENDTWLYAKIADFDIGLSPLVAHPFNEAKSAFKAKQYLSCGVPVVASDIGENNKFVTNGANGFLCESPDDFMEAIDHIVSLDQAGYDALISHALATKEAFSLQSYCAALLDKLISPTSTASPKSVPSPLPLTPSSLLSHHQNE